MAATFKSIYRRFNGTDWDTHYFKTSADVIVETASYKILTAAERTQISDYLTTFNGINNLLQLDASGLIPSALIPSGLDYLPLAGGTLSGSLNMGSQDITNINEINVGTVQSLPATDLNINSVVGQKILFSAGNNIIDAGGGKIINMSPPTTTDGAATKSYVDNLVATSTHPASAPVQVASTVNLTLSGEQVVDGVSLVSGVRVLVKDQTTASENGVYTVLGTAWTKVTEDSTEGTLVFIEQGTTHNDWLFYNSTGTAWVEFSKVDTITAGLGLTKSGTDLSISTLGVTNGMLNGSIEWTKLVSETIDSRDSYTAAHTWAGLEDDATDAPLLKHIIDAKQAIRLLRGTASYNTDNSRTIEGVYDIANVKIQSYIGTDPSTIPTPTSGDLFFETI
jgi:hypothetical protein